MNETFEQKFKRITAEHVAITAYDPTWPDLFALEKAHLLSCLPNELIVRIEHFGSTAVSGLAAKPIIDMLIEVTSLEDVKVKIVPILETQGYDYFWQPEGDLFYCWLIKRDDQGRRTHHLHMVEKHFPHWQRLLFRDYLIDHPEIAREYQELKYQLAQKHPGDRIAYHNAKTDFITKVTQAAKEYYDTV